MSFIERALEQLKPEPERATPEPTRPTVPQARLAPSASPGPVMPCRADRVIRLDYTALRAAGLVGPENERRRIAEEFRLIKRHLLKAIARNDSETLSNIVVVTSAVPGEGKTFTSVNLALSLAVERDFQVVLVDGDVAKRNITNVLGLAEDTGLLDAAGSASFGFEQTIFPTDVESLYVMPAGNKHLEATEILASERMASLFAQLASERHRIVLIDSPPLLATTEAGVLVSLAGQVAIVVRASGTPQNAVLSAIETIPEDKPVSLVLNQILSIPERHYGYHYGDYGSYGEDQGKATQRPMAQEETKG